MVGCNHSHSSLIVNIIADTVAAAEVAAEVEILAGNGHTEFSELDKGSHSSRNFSSNVKNDDPITEVSVEAPLSNGHGHKIDDEVLEVSRLEAQLHSNSDNIPAEVSTGNGHDSKVHDDTLHALEGL